MNIKVTANIENHGKAGFVAWIDSIKGLVVQAKTLEEVLKELMISLKVKMAHSLGVPAKDIIDIDEREAKRMQKELIFKGSDKIQKKEINLTFS